jgi:2,3-dihydroxy-2,3-dihydro-p-cumate dehydrogenase
MSPAPASDFGFSHEWLKDRVAIVTGGANGIGYVIAERLARDGAKLALGDVDETALGKAAARLEEISGYPVPTTAGDLAEEAHATALIAAAQDAFGCIDILVNNAGGGVISPFLEHTPETLKTTIDRNLWTAIWCCRAALPVMIDQGFGRIVNIGADSVRNGLWDHAAYNAAKGGMHGLTTGLAREFAGNGVTVNTVAPCATRTPQLDEYIEKSPDVAQKFIDIIPTGRPAEMAEIASMVSYLASAEAAFVTGQVISVNGGSTML